MQFEEITEETELQNEAAIMDVVENADESAMEPSEEEEETEETSTEEEETSTEEA